MSRVAKRGMDYFPLDVLFEQDDRIIYLRKHGGDKAILAYLRLLAVIYRVGLCYRFDEVAKDVLPDLISLNPEECEIILSLLRKSRLLDPDLMDRGWLSSRGIQKRFLRIISDRRLKKIKIPEGVLLLKESELPDGLEVTYSSDQEKEIEREKERETIRKNSGLIRNNPELCEIKKLKKETEESDQNANPEHQKFDEFGTEVERYIDGLGISLSEPEKEELRGVFSVLKEIDSEELASSNLWIISHKRPMKKYPHIWLTVQQLHQIWKSYIQAGLRPGVDFPKIFLDVESKLSKKTRWEHERVDAYSWLIGWALKQATDQLTSEQRLVNAKEASARYGSAMR